MRILVTAASKYGATGESAASIAEQLRSCGHTVEIPEPELVHNFDGIDAIVRGSSVYAGHWLQSARELVDRLGPELVPRPVWIFSSEPIGAPAKPEGDAVDVVGVLAATGAAEHRVFAGQIDKATLSFAERAMIRAFRADVGDFRDWKQIKK